jgi:ketosteroid isomerase-like protein
MSQENVELVVALHRTDLGRVYREDAVWAAWSASLAPDFAHVAVNGIDGTTVATDAEGMRRAWLSWVAPFVTYRQEVEEAIDCGDRVVVHVNHFGRVETGTGEVKLSGAGIWTVRDGKVVRLESYSDRSEALKAVGLAE